jgi:hypothetical protein
MRRRSGLNSAAIASVEATTTSWEASPVNVRKTYWRENTLPTYTRAREAVSRP